jgi:hypothetical protein
MSESNVIGTHGTTGTGRTYYVGLDVHKTRSTFCVLDPDGKEVRCVEVKGDGPGWPRLLAALDRDVPRPFRACFEASCGYGPLFSTAWPPGRPTWPSRTPATSA